MKCENFREQTESFVDNEISPAVKSRFEIHLRECQLCRFNLENLRAVRKALKINLPAAPSKQFDARVLQAFSEKQKQTANNKSSGWRNIFVPLFNPQAAWALTAAVFVIGIFAAFQIGKLSATDVQINLPFAEVINSASPEIKEAIAPPATITKIVELPVVKERIVTRVVYIEREKQNGVQAEQSNSKLPKKTSLNNSIANNDYLTEINLKGFQPASEITATVIKGEDNDRK